MIVTDPVHWKMCFSRGKLFKMIWHFRRNHYSIQLDRPESEGQKVLDSKKSSGFFLILNYFYHLLSSVENFQVAVASWDIQHRKSDLESILQNMAWCLGQLPRCLADLGRVEILEILVALIECENWVHWLGLFGCPHMDKNWCQRLFLCCLRIGQKIKDLPVPWPTQTSSWAFSIDQL